jgi:hypothetical protein
MLTELTDVVFFVVFGCVVVVSLLWALMATL